MPAARIFCLARTSRCPIVGSGTRKARAISAMLKPPSVRKVSATCASRFSAGWQQVKISRRRSSSSDESLPWFSIANAPSPGVVCSPSKAYFSAPTRARRKRSIALARAAVVSQAAGFSGTPLSGQRSSACTKASCSASSARSKSPQARISDAMIRPYSRRKTCSTLSRAFGIGRAGRLRPVRPRRRRRSELGCGSIKFHDRPYLHRATTGKIRHLAGPGDRRIQIGRIDQIVAAELLLGLGEGAIDDDRAAIGESYGGRRRDRLERLAGEVLAGLLQVGGVLPPGVHLSGLGFGGFGRCGLLVPIDQQQVAHGFSLSSTVLTETSNGNWAFRHPCSSNYRVICASSDESSPGNCFICACHLGGW